MKISNYSLQYKGNYDVSWTTFREYSRETKQERAKLIDFYRKDYRDLNWRFVHREQDIKEIVMEI